MFATTMKRILATSIVIGRLSLVPAHAGAAAPEGLINRPMATPFVCMTDEGYGRRNSCDRGGA
jgi:hypothetical protein